ncbi:TatD family hydrolase [Allobaculum sp. JKK-2023]|uniref:TatD family hydrolase n=1 Tax=Allobaculum sp. JKK-2023 TaxID=3108943 RepID=UPI002B054DFA|nr:TatD family hydrolase [Allobaculum sp. JKK-2023]
MITDTHCHITCDELYPQVEEILERAQEAGVDLMMVMCTNKTEYLRALDLKFKHPELLKVAFGFYPGDAQDITQEDLDFLRQEAMSGRMDVLGEIGLDYYWDTSFKDLQKDLFKKQIELANEANLPISIHMRDASRDTMDLLEQNAKTPVILHCFSGSLPIMEEALKHKMLISFAGPITYKNNKQGPANVAACPVECLLSETDSPYLSPVPHRGHRNEPAFVQATVQKIADIKELDFEEVNQQIRRNFEALFAAEKSDRNSVDPSASLPPASSQKEQALASIPSFLEQFDPSWKEVIVSEEENAENK